MKISCLISAQNGRQGCSHCICLQYDNGGRRGHHLIKTTVWAEEMGWDRDIYRDEQEVLENPLPSIPQEGLTIPPNPELV